MPPEHPEIFEGDNPDTLGSIEENINDLNNATNKLNKINTTTTIDVLVAYTQSAANASGDIQALIQLAIVETNQSYSNSGISLSLNLVNTTQVSYTESGSFYTDRDRFISPTDGYMDNIHSLRNQHSADVCVLIINNDDYCGLAADINVTEAGAFCVVHYDCATGYYSFAHEIGHLQGARHDRNVDPNLTPYQYGHGFIYPSANWRTIMSYANYCSGCSRIQYWSNPNKTYNGVSMGTATYENNARVLNERASAVSNFRIAATTSGTLSANEIWDYNNLTGNIIVPTGITLTIKSSATVILNSYYIKSTGGTITLQTGSTITGLNAYLKSSTNVLKGLFPSIQSAVTNASSSQTVELLSKTYSETFNISSKSNIEIKGQGQGSTILNNPFSITNSSYTDVHDLKAKNVITINSANVTWLTNITFVTSTTVNDYSGAYTNLAYSAALSGGASFAYNSYGGAGDIFSNNIENYDVAAYLTSSADYNVGTDNEFCNNLLDIYAGGGAYAYAISNTYSYSGAVQGNVFVTGVNDVCSMSKSNPLAKTSTAEKDNSLSEIYLSILRKIRNEKTDKIAAIEKYRAEFENLATENKNLLLNSIDLETIQETISNLYHIYMTLNEKEELYDFIDTKLNDSKFSNYQVFLKKYLVWDLVDQNRFDEALNLTNSLFEQSSENNLKAELLYQKGLLYKYYLQKDSAAYLVFNELANNYKDNLLSKFAVNEINSLNDNNIENKLAANSKEEKITLENYPNPFNPTTIINYTLPQKSHVEIKVFDILGRETAELINEIKEKGSYEIQFNGSKLSSGIYILTLRAGNTFISNKMLLIK